MSVFLLLALLASLSAADVAAQGRGDEQRVHPGLAADMAANPGGSFRVIVQWQRNPRAVEVAMRSNGGRKLRDLSIDGFVAEMPVQAIEGLSHNPWVKAITPDAELLQTGYVSSAALRSIYPMTVNADFVWQTGISGSGIGIAVIDSGIDTTLSDFRTTGGASRVVVRKTFIDPPPTQLDPSGHGTLVAGIAAGNSWNNPNSTLRGRYMGIAPQAHLIDLVVADASGKSYTSDVVEAIEWAIANRVTYNIRVINLSLVSSLAESYKSSVLAAAVERAWFNGIFVVAAAGNVGPNTSQYPPANDPFVVTVGASDSRGTWTLLDDTMAPWSSYGTTQDGLQKPDVAAPGRYIAGPIATSNPALLGQFPSRALANTSTSYMWMSGTSMAAPVVAGIAALAFELHPSWTNDQLKWLLVGTSTRVGANSSTWAAQGAGIVDAFDSVHYPFKPAHANQGLTMSTQLSLAGTSPAYSSASWSSASWSSASWSSASWSSASWSSASWSSSGGVSMTQLQTSAVDLDAPEYVEAEPRE